MTRIDAVGRHYSQFFGKPNNGYSILLDQHPEGHYDIVEYKDVPWGGAVTLATYGFSDIHLHPFRQELVFSCYERFVSEELVAWIAGVEQNVATCRHALQQGEVLWARRPLSSSTVMEAMYSAVPTYFPDEFQVVDAKGVKIDIGWLIPLYRSEANWIEEQGWRAFEVALVEGDPDVMDLTRSPIM